jgi:capping protein alpha
LRSAIDAAVHSYVRDHYPQGVCAVYASADQATVTIVIAANRYNPSNYWNGRWRALWTFSVADSSLTGLLRAHVHYYEDGNVQLVSEKNLPAQNLTASPADLSAAIVAVIKEQEAVYQTALNESYGELSDTTFKGLRRALPVTRNKMDWSKIINYSVGASLQKAQQQQ